MQSRRGRTLTLAAGVGFVATAALHTMGDSTVASAALEITDQVGVLIPALWLSFSFHYVVMGMLMVIAWRQAASRMWLVIALATIVPLADALLQIQHLGFIPPTAILLGLAVLTLVAALRSGTGRA